MIRRLWARLWTCRTQGHLFDKNLRCVQCGRTTVLIGFDFS